MLWLPVLLHTIYRTLDVLHQSLYVLNLKCVTKYDCLFWGLTCEATIVFLYSDVLESFHLIWHLFSISWLVFIEIATWQSDKKIAASYGLPYIPKFRICLWNLDVYVGFNKWDRLCTRNMQFLMPIIYDGNPQPSIRCIDLGLHTLQCSSVEQSGAQFSREVTLFMCCLARVTSQITKLQMVLVLYEFKDS